MLLLPHQQTALRAGVPKTGSIAERALTALKRSSLILRPDVKSNFLYPPATVPHPTPHYLLQYDSPTLIRCLSHALIA